MYEEEEEEEEGFFDMLMIGFIETVAQLIIYMVLLPFIALFESIFSCGEDEEDDDFDDYFDD